MVKLVPPDPFEPEDYLLSVGTVLYRVFRNNRRVTEFNPGGGGRTRFAFFGDPVVPVLYAAETEEAAVCESILHEVPPTGGSVQFDYHVEDRVAASFTPSRDLRLASLMGDGLRILGTEARHVTGTMASQYKRTVRWAKAAHGAGYDGLVWMSNRRNTDRAYVLFGDRVAADDFEALPDYGRVFGTGLDLDWLIDYCTRLKVDVQFPNL